MVLKKKLVGFWSFGDRHFFTDSCKEEHGRRDFAEGEKQNLIALKTNVEIYLIPCLIISYV
jgi:hypothetical protein